MTSDQNARAVYSVRPIKPVLSNDQHTNLVIKARRVVAWLRAVALVNKLSTPVMPEFPGNLEISALVCAAIARDPDILKELVRELDGLINAYSSSLNYQNERSFACGVLSELRELEKFVRQKQDAGGAPFIY